MGVRYFSIRNRRCFDRYPIDDAIFYFCRRGAVWEPFISISKYIYLSVLYYRLSCGHSPREPRGHAIIIQPFSVDFLFFSFGVPGNLHRGLLKKLELFYMPN